MKIAISIPDDIFEAAEAVAAERGLARSQLYALALREYLADRGPAAITARLDQVYTDSPSKLDEAWASAQAQAIEHETW